MVWVIKTRYSIGLWLHDPQNEKKLHLEKTLMIKFLKYEDAENFVRQEASESISWDQFYPNRLYKIRDDRIYVVFYNRIRTGFAEMENAEELVPKDQERFYRKKWRLTYNEAVALVTQLGAETGSDRIFARKNPVCGRFYLRKRSGSI